ncbi:NAD(P)/FAD-dependent oxidoreductase [Patescibacteria group bacterium]|nr:NAD(P)/FAD-dependent oxidoreductase [Patescibacteria group bacterium]
MKKKKSQKTSKSSRTTKSKIPNTKLNSDQKIASDSKKKISLVTKRKHLRKKTTATKPKIAIIIGAGPAGLTAAYELLKNTKKNKIKPIIFEATNQIGGISQTINYKGNRIDIGGHRFFSKSDRIMEWWQNILPIENKKVEKLHPRHADKVMLKRKRLSRIFFLRKLFDYPISLSKNTLLNLGPIRIIKIGFSYIKARIIPIKTEKSLQDFLINRFGKELYLTFFKDYTQKVWGVPCTEIKPEWGAQRIKGLSITKTLIDAFKNLRKTNDDNLSQKDTETSLIKQFLYPKFGPGQMWEEVAGLVKKMGGEIHLNHPVNGIEVKNNRIESVEVKNLKTGHSKTVKGKYFFSTMPVKDLIKGMGTAAPPKVKKVASQLKYRDFITVGLLLEKLKLKKPTDNWIYIQERDVKLGRLQIFNNWSPYMVKDPTTTWIGLEYFCNEGDKLWRMPPKKFAKFAIDELTKIDIIEKADVIDSTVIKIPKTYPAYFGAYEHFDKIREFTDKIPNLFLIGRNGMHRYNNADHSMLTAIIAVENIIKNVTTKENIWAVNTEKQYHENK